MDADRTERAKSIRAARDWLTGADMRSRARTISREI